LLAVIRPARAADERAVAAALKAAGAWYYRVDANHVIREVFPVSATARAMMIGRDIRSFLDPLNPLNEHPRMARAFQAREPFRDLMLPFTLGRPHRMLRISGEPVHDRRGRFVGYRGLAIDMPPAVARPDAAISLIAPDLQRALTNTLVAASGYAQFLQAD